MEVNKFNISWFATILGSGGSFSINAVSEDVVRKATKPVTVVRRGAHL